MKHLKKFENFSDSEFEKSVTQNQGYEKSASDEFDQEEEFFDDEKDLDYDDEGVEELDRIDYMNRESDDEFTDGDDEFGDDEFTDGDDEFGDDEFTDGDDGFEDDGDIDFEPEDDFGDDNTSHVKGFDDFASDPANYEISNDSGLEDDLVDTDEETYIGNHMDDPDEETGNNMDEPKLERNNFRQSSRTPKRARRR